MWRNIVVRFFHLATGKGFFQDPDKSHLLQLWSAGIFGPSFKSNVMKAMIQKVSIDWNENFMLYAATSIIVCTCLGGFAVFSIFTESAGLMQKPQIFTVVAVTSNVLASILTVQKPNIVLKAVSVSVVVSTLLMAINLLF